MSSGNFRRTFRVKLVAAAIAFAMLAASPSRAQTQGEAPAALANPTEEFERQFGALKKQLETLGGRIKDSAKEIEGLTSAEAARKEIAGLQAMIADTLGLVASNGDVATLGQWVLEHAKAKQKLFETDTKFSPEERQFLQREWAKVGVQTEAAVRDMTGARERLLGMLKSVQARGDFIDELKALKNAQKMLEVIRALAAELRGASDALQSFSQAISPPAAGI